MCIEKCKHGSGRGLHKPTLEIRKGGAFLLYYVGDNMMIHCGDPIKYASIGTSYWQEHFYAFGRLN
ncbi:hypothetical protein K360107B91_42280 [Enterocloster bolteae]